MKTDYHINIFYSEEDAGYIADIPDLVHCSAFGNTPEEALAAKKVWLEAVRAEGKSIPAPKYHPVIYQLAGQSSLEFWDNALDDEDWNNA